MQDLNNTYKKFFLKVFFSVFSILFIILLFLFLGYRFFYAKPVYDPTKQRDSSLITEKELQQQTEQQSKGIFTPPIRTNVLITGVDKAENLTDVIMVASFISTTGNINLASIPRDTYINFEGKDLETLRKINRKAPSHMKLNSVYAYTKKTNMDMLKATLEDKLGIKIDYYVKINLEAFKSIVDAVGGIYFDVPKGGLRYTDPTQDLYINLKEGYQLLDGKDAEGLVRFRKGYARQDLQRVEIQQQFIKEFLTQVLKKETIVNNLGELFLNFIKYVETDFSISDFPKYINTISKIDGSKIQTATLGGSPQTIDGLSYYMLDPIQVKDTIDKFFYGSTTLQNSPISSNENTDIQNITSTPKN